MVIHNQPVVIDFSHSVSPFEELWPTTHRALLPIIGKPILLHVLELLRNSGYRHFRIARHLQQPFVKNRLGNGEEWGITLRYSDLAGSELLNETLMCFGEAVMLYGDQLLEANVAFDCDTDAEFTYNKVLARSAGHYSVSDGHISFQTLTTARGTPAAINTVREYLDASFRSSSKFERIETAPGAKIHRSAQSDWKTHIAPDVLVGDSCFVGKHCRLSRGAVLGGNCVLGNGVYVDKLTRLNNCVVLPNTYIGKGVVLNDCVVSSRGVVNTHDEYSVAPARSVLCATRRSRESTTGLPRDIRNILQP